MDRVQNTAWNRLDAGRTDSKKKILKREGYDVPQVLSAPLGGIRHAWDRLGEGGKTIKKKVNFGGKKEGYDPLPEMTVPFQRIRNMWDRVDDGQKRAGMKMLFPEGYDNHESSFHQDQAPVPVNVCLGSWPRSWPC